MEQGLFKPDPVNQQLREAVDLIKKPEVRDSARQCLAQNEVIGPFILWIGTNIAHDPVFSIICGTSVYIGCKFILARAIANINNSEK